MDLVVDIINAKNKQWKMDVVTFVFNDEVTENILHIPFAEVPHTNTQVWRGEASGNFSVRSAYKLLQSGRPLLGLNNLQIDAKNFYKQLWGLILPSKIKIHM